MRDANWDFLNKYGPVVKETIENAEMTYDKATRKEAKILVKTIQAVYKNEIWMNILAKGQPDEQAQAHRRKYFFMLSLCIGMVVLLLASIFVAVAVIGDVEMSDFDAQQWDSFIIYMTVFVTFIVFVLFFAFRCGRELYLYTWDAIKSHELKETVEADPEFVEEIYGYSTANEESLAQSELCGCFFCMETFPYAHIKEWREDEAGKSARCPCCGTNSVIGSASGLPITHEYLEELNELLF